MLTDDVDFILEVRQGVAEAPDMDPAYELSKLKKKFEIWKKEFKVRRGEKGQGRRRRKGVRTGGSGGWVGGRREWKERHERRSRATMCCSAFTVALCPTSELSVIFLSTLHA